MTEDARFEDGGETPLRLRAFDAEDLQVVSALVQDAVFPGNEMAWLPKSRRFALLLNRFRWEDRGRQKGAFERVQAVLAVEDVLKISTQGIERKSDMIYAILTLEFLPAADGAGRLVLTLAGDGAIALEVEALEVTLRDVTRPYRAVSGLLPIHE